MAQGSKILVTGASGFVGIHLVEKLISHGNTDVFAAVYGNDNKLANLIPSEHIISGDLTSYEFTDNLISKIKPDIVYNLAALSVVHDSDAKGGVVLTANTMLQYNMLESCRKHVPKVRFLAICSANEYGLVDEKDLPIDENTPLRPLNSYAVSKVSQDILAYQYYLAYGLDVVRLRPFNHTGEGQTRDFVIPELASQFAAISANKQEPKITLGNLESIRDFTDVKDMVDAYIMASEKCISGEVYNIGFGKGISIMEIVKLLENISGVKVEIVKSDMKLRKSDVPVLIADASKFKQVTGWEPKIKFKDTLERVYNYCKSQSIFVTG